MAPHQSPSGPTKPRIIKRYLNRKLYDTVDSCYVTLEEIGELIQQGMDIKVIDNASGEDLTSVTLAQIIFEAEKKTKNVMPMASLLTLVRSAGESVREFVHKSLETGAQEVEYVREEISTFVDRLIKRGDVKQEDRASLLSSIRKSLDHKLRSTVENVSNIPVVQSEIKSLVSRIEELEQRLKKQETKR